MTSIVATELRRACQLTGARWAAVLGRHDDQWVIHSAWGLTKRLGRRLEGRLQGATLVRSIERVRAGGRSELKAGAELRELGIRSLEVFRSLGGTPLLVANQTSRAVGRRMWPLVAELVHMMGQRSAATMPAPNPQTSVWLADLAAAAARAHDVEELHRETAPILEGALGAIGLHIGIGAQDDAGNTTATRSRNRAREAGSRILVVPIEVDGQTVGLLKLVVDQHPMPADNVAKNAAAAAKIIAAALGSLEERSRLEAGIAGLASQLQEAHARAHLSRDAESRLIQAAKLVAVGEMAAGIAHELNNPLTTIAGFTELILDETPQDSQRRADLELVLRESARARSVVRRLLDFARQSEGAKARADVNEVLEDVLALTTNYIHTSGVQLETRLSDGLPWIVLDSDQMKQVFINLIHNALHAMPAGGRLAIKSGVSERSGKQWIVVSVQDNGIGIEEQDLDRIFEPFFTTRSAHGGTGLGLSVTYGIVADHGGTIEVASRPGSGATFSVWLPV